MRTLFFLFFPIVLFSCSSSTKYEKTIINYLETDKKGIRTDLQIEVLSIDVSDITVLDSIKILQDQFNTEKNKKITSIEESINRLKVKIEKTIGKKQYKVVNKSLALGWQRDIEKLENELLITQNWGADYLNKYDSLNPSDVLAKKVDCKFSFFNPQLQTKQELKALFVLSADGKQCYNMIK